jgi:hypothetical protein
VGPNVEPIPDEDRVSRLIESPIHYGADSDLLWVQIFQFNDNQCESLVWRKYAPTANDVHAIGAAMVAEKKKKRPEREYVGFITGVKGPIAAYRNFRGHGFLVVHEPEEDKIFHCHICYAPNPNTPFQANDKSELKLALRSQFLELDKP